VNWIKKGLLLTPRANLEWMSMATMVPFVEPLGSGAYRVYFSGRDSNGRSRTGCFETDLSGSARARDLHPQPVLDLGALGAFDDSGVVGYAVVDAGGVKYLYYGGWSLGVTVPYYFSIGLATSDAAGVFRRYSGAPILSRDAVDPFLNGAPSILIENGRWRMWYASGAGWISREGQTVPRMHIKYAESQDGIHWERGGTVCVDASGPGEYAVVRPCVLRRNGLYRMWYSCRGARYRIGYAESRDGFSWDRQDGEAGIDVSTEGWDSEMVEYAHVFTHAGRLHMLYNGNGYGRSGIGLAVEEGSGA
jgi:hypothetical protein